MTDRDYKAEIEALGYEVHECDGGLRGTLEISGYGLRTFVPADDTEQLADLADPEHHAERIAPPEEPAEQTGPTPMEQLEQRVTRLAARVDELEGSPSDPRLES